MGRGGPSGRAPCRRDLLAWAALAGSASFWGCAPSGDGGSIAAAEVYVGLGRARAVAILDAVTDRVRGRIALAPLGTRGLPWRIGVGSRGEAAVLPIMPVDESAPSVGVIAQSPPTDRGWSISPGQNGGPGGAASRGAKADGDSGRCALVRVGTGYRTAGSNGTSEAVQALSADARGRAYVLVGDGTGVGPSYAAVVDLRTGALLRHLPAAAAGESVLALLAQPDGERLFVAVWSWQEPPGGWGRGAGPGRLVALDTRTGQALAQATLPHGAAATDLAFAARPPTAARLGVSEEHAVFAVLADPGPSLDDDWWVPGTRFSLASFGAERLADAGTWALDGRPSALAVLPDGARAYLLDGSLYGARPGQLVSLDLASGMAARRWNVPSGALALAVSQVGKAYVADGFGNRLWRFDTRTDTLLGDMPMPGAPIALAARPV